MNAVLAEAALKNLNKSLVPAKPFLKWVGGKRQLLSELLKHVPDEFNAYHEPFLGGAALFYALEPDSAVLSDLNDRLLRTYKSVRDEPMAVIALLETYPYDKEFYLRLRAVDIDNRSDAEVAAWMLYVTKTGFNGLYRVNKSGGFNVPFGRYNNPTICDSGRLMTCSAALQNVTLAHGDFMGVEERAKSGDFVYFDPPYVPLNATSSFTSYTRDGFTIDDQIRLRDLALRLKESGVHVLLSNSSAEVIRELYSPKFNVKEVMASRSINSKASGRGKVAELLMW
jgi:DNA adenine methylase